MKNIQLSLPILTFTCLVLSVLNSLPGRTQNPQEIILMNFTGEVELQESGESGFQKLTEFSIGSVLEDEDQFRLSPEATLMIICADGQEKPFPPGQTTQVSQICTPEPESP